MFQTKAVEIIKTQFLCRISPPPRKSCAVYELMCNSTVSPDRPQTTIWRMRTECWIPKATNTHSEYVILIAFSNTTMVAQARHIVTLDAHCLYCCIFNPLLQEITSKGKVFPLQARCDPEGGYRYSSTFPWPRH